MCGILGLVHYNKSAPTYMEAKLFRKAITSLLKYSQIRGYDATGLLLMTDEKASLFKHNLPADKFITTTRYSNILKNLNRRDHFRAMIGHVRQKTKGSQSFNVNNHPITANRIVGVHNGIIGNDDYLFDKYVAHLDRAGKVDSEIIFRLIEFYRKQNKSFVDSVKLTCEDITGSYACAFADLEDTRYITLFTNRGSIDVFIYTDLKLIVFASSKYILTKALNGNSGLDPKFVTHHISMWQEGIRIDTQTGKIFKFDLGKKKQMSILPSIHRSGGCSLEGVPGLYINDCDHLCNGCPHYK